MKKILIVPNQFKDKGFKVTLRVAKWLFDHKLACYIPEDLKGANALMDPEYSMCFSFVEDNDLHDMEYCIVLGGDGTIIQTSRTYYDYEIPMLGINLGNLGFLAEVEVSELEKTLEEFLKGNYIIENRMMVSACFEKGDFLGNALNDVVISRQSISRMINFDVHVNGMFVNSYRADGVILSTPTGSTAYNLSAGGPIISPVNEIYVMTPICPHSLTARSIVLSGDDVVSITFKHPRNKHVDDLLVTVDGQETTRIYKEDTIVIKKGPKKVQLIRLNNSNFFDILRRKL